MTKKPRRPKDPNKLAKAIVDIATGNTPEPKRKKSEEEKNPAAVSLGRLGGLKGGVARAASLTAEQRSKIAKKAAKSRWKKK